MISFVYFFVAVREQFALLSFVPATPAEQQRPAWTLCGYKKHGSSKQAGKEGNGLVGCHLPPAFAPCLSPVCVGGVGWVDFHGRCARREYPGSCHWSLSRFICAALHSFWKLAGYKLENKNGFISTFQVFTKFRGGSGSASLSPLSPGSRCV